MPGKNYKGFLESIYEKVVSVLYFLIKHWLVIFGILTVGFGITGFLINGEPVSVSILKAIMMFALEFPTDPNVLNWALYLSIVFAVLTLVSAVVLIFLKKKVDLYLLQISLKREHILVFGLGEAVTSFLDGYIKENRKEHIVIIEADPDNKKLEEYRKQKFGVYIGDSLSDETFELFNFKTMKYAIIAMGTDKINIELAKKIINAYKEKKEETQISLIIHIQNRDLDILFHQDFILPHQGLNKEYEPETAESVKKQKIEIKTFSFFNEAAEELFEKHSIDGDSDKYIKSEKGFHSILIGNGELMKSVIYQMALLSHLPNENIHTVHIVDKQATELLSKIKKHLYYHTPSDETKSDETKPEEIKSDNFPGFVIEPVSIDRDSLTFFEDPIWHKEDLVNVIIAYDAENENLDLAIELFNRVYLSKAKEDQDMPEIIFAMYDSLILNEIINKNKDSFKHFHTFGNNETVLSYNNLIEEEKYALAKLIHSKYVDNSPGKPKSNKDKPAEKKQDEKAEDEWYNSAKYSDKLSNIAQAQHIDMKLKAMGFKREKIKDLEELIESAKKSDEKKKQLEVEKEELLKENRSKIFGVFEEYIKNLKTGDKGIIDYTGLIDYVKNSSLESGRVNYFPKAYDTLFDKMIRMEHNRWNAYHYLNGWKYAKIKAKIIKEHNCLLPLADFKELEMQKKVNNDIYSFLNLPDYLAEVGYKIVPIKSKYS